MFDFSKFRFIKSGFIKSKSRLNLSKPHNNFIKYKIEAISILLGSVFFILLLSLISYNSTDRSWFYFSADNGTVQNWCGVIGANFSALLFYLFGVAAYLFVFGFAFFAYRLFVDRGSNQKYLNRIFAFILFTCSFAAILFAYNINPALVSVNSLAGGLIGSSFFDLISYPLGRTGSNIFHFTMVLACGIIVSRISFFTILKNFLYVSYKFLKLSISYLLKTIIVFGKFLGKILWNFIKYLYIKCKKWVLSLTSNVSTLVCSSYFNKDKEQLIVTPYHTEVVRGATTIESYSSTHSQIQSGIKKFKNKQFFKISRKAPLVKFNFLFLPNTIFNKNIFEKDFGTKFLKTLSMQKLNIINNDSITLKTEERQITTKAPKIEYKLPDTSIFEREQKADENLRKKLEAESVHRGKLLEEKLGYFGIKGKITAIRPGPVITLFEYKPEIDSKISKIISLEDDLALALMAISIRIVAPIPGRSVVGFEISNKIRQKVFLSDLLNSKEFKNFDGRLPIVFGVDIVGNTVIQDLAGMPHLLVAGSTGSGKSVGLNAMLVSLLCSFAPDELKLILIDPKRLEFAPYRDIPHLLFPIITNPRSAAPVLKWLVQEMERRYDQMAEAGVRNISEYQDLTSRDLTNRDLTNQDLTNSEFPEMPFIVLMIDELADLMMVAGKDVELHIARIAQMARAAGIHMVVATQRPSVDVVTGLIKVNFPSRLAFRVTSKIDSRTIVDGSGAEKLLGRGDMLYMNSASSDLQRIHGAYVGVKEVEKLTGHLRAQAKPEYLDLNETLKEMSQSEVEAIEDKLYPDVVEFIRTVDELSISGLQRKYRIGFNRSARLIEKLEFDGLLAPAQGSKPRKVIKTSC